MSRSNQSKQPNAWGANSNARNGRNAKTPSSSERKFKEAQSILQAAAKKYANTYESSSDEDEALTEDVVDLIVKNYKQNDVQNEHIERTQVFLQDAVTYGSSVCLICISRIKRNDQIWNCDECYCGFHLMCIQRWSKDTIVQQKQALEQQIQVRQIKVAWYCPKCRHEYSPDNIPSKYECYCKKVVDPTSTPLLAPHSCGSACDKDLKPPCSHRCVLLCHPGPCPPCPKTVEVACHCGSQPPKTRRCNQKEWSCGKACEKPLPCGKHTCTSVCHSGDCPPCPKKSIQRCICGLSRKLRDCTTPVWQCDKVCNKLLDCKRHNCSEVCHFGECDTCILSKPRTCPCGKSKYDLPCTEEVPTCGDTCGKILECGIHICNRRCHKDNCSPCLETVTKSCRCGLHTKEVQCKKPYTCDTKCKQMKDCNKHPCNRKCCDGNCPPCEKVCGHVLNCGNHKCASVCHRGPCYPCNLTETVSCHCGATTLTVPCGRKHKTKPPKCSKPCKVPPDCHHQKREVHRCHFGECPPCKQKCNKKHTKCGHICPAPCHSSVLVKIETQKGSMPWEQTKPQFEKRALDCPNCTVPVAVTCLGGHETVDYPCYLAKCSSCYRMCGRLLKCENHTCSLPCHKVEEALNDQCAEVNCESCEKPCTKPRPDGCQHACTKPCHPNGCPPCKQMFRINCHCRLIQKYIYCNDWTDLSKDKTEMQSCGNQCPLNLKCGHRCRMTCHPEPCPEQTCKKKVKIACKCKRLKKEFICESLRNEQPVVDCDDVCIKKKIEEEEAKKAAIKKRLEEEEIKNKIELEKYEKMFKGKKKSKDRRAHGEAQEKNLIQKHRFLIISFVLVLISISAYFTLLL